MPQQLSPLPLLPHMTLTPYAKKWRSSLVHSERIVE